MYWWNTKKLAEDIKGNKLTESNKKNYYIAVSLITLIGIYISYSNVRNSYLVIFLEAILAIIITIVGVNMTFKTNKGNEGSDYIARVVCLSFPILIKLNVFSLVVVFIYSFISSLLYGGIIVKDWIIALISVVIQVLYFWRINVNLRYINA